MSFTRAPFLLLIAGAAMASAQVPTYTPAPPRTTGPAPFSPRPTPTPTPMQTAAPGPAPFSPRTPPLARSPYAPAYTPPSAPALTPAPAPAFTPAPPPSAPPAYRGDWRDWPLTPGNWVYRQDARGSIALFGVPGADAEFTIRCDRIAGQIYISRKGAAPGNAPATFRTSSSLRTLAMQPTGATPAYMALTLFPRDPLLDAIGYSRGRFVVEQATLPTLVIPAWAETLRVSEDCRP
ncbi:hypothetical protein [Sphingomonas sp. 28-62-11]|uniref:hypothetical protein n=1 Tax=Sphingomonas sp. 28-62-11 TaxID=1970432 RepID=UPI0035A8834B